MQADLVIGIDGGGSRTRVTLAGLDGAVVRTVTTGGTNLTTIGEAIVRPRLAAAIIECLTGVRADTRAAPADTRAGPPDGTTAGSTPGGMFDIPGIAVRYAVAGYAGAGDAGRAAAVTEAALAAAGVHCPVEVYADPELAFASGATGPDGLVLVAGTGAVAGRVVGWRATRLIDGHGWLLGDDGSGFWIAVAGLRAVLRDLDGRGPRTALSQLLPAELGVRTGGTGHRAGDLSPQAGEPVRPIDAQRLRGALVRAVMSQPPPGLARLAKIVLNAVDDVAAEIVDTAVGHLVTTVAALDPGPGEPLVLAGGVAGRGSSLSERLAKTLAERFGVQTVIVTDGSAGAIRLALLRRADWTAAT
jgi:N-acetylglucosamine kinase-like BadF-type ATPase